MYIYFNKTKAFLETFSDSGSRFLKSFEVLIFILLQGEKMLKENGIRV